jgi:PTH1 family peptidyl-tRNA hydrolase
MWMFVGLGNPGKDYAHNRHNVGFMAISEMSDGAVFFNDRFKKKFNGQFAEFQAGGQKMSALLPLTYMNNSGQSVAAAAQFYKIPAERIIVIHDELDLKPGEVRVKKGGGNAGHNGLKSIQAHLGTADFWRVRIGIGHPGERDMVSDYVLSDFAKADKIWLDRVFEGLREYYPLVASEGVEAFSKKIEGL